MKNLLGNFKIYPRGFLGAPLEPILERKPRPTGRIQYDVSLFDTNDTTVVVANLNVESAYQSVARNDLIARKFDFKENALQQFMWAFGTTSFSEWYAAQFQSPSFGERHRDFLDDTLHFLYTGNRRMAIQNWNLILDEDERRLGNVQLSQTAINFFGRKTLAEVRNVKSTIDEIVNLWMRQPGGFADMLSTGHILFGINE